MCNRGTVVRLYRGGMAGGDDGLLRIVGLELFREGAAAELSTDLGGLETVAVVGKLQPVDFPLLVLHALDRDATSVEFVEKYGVTRQAFSFVLLWCVFSCVLSLFVVLILWFRPMRTDVITALSLGP